MEDEEIVYAVLHGETFTETVFRLEYDADEYCTQKSEKSIRSALDELGTEDYGEAGIYAGQQGDYWHVEEVDLTGRKDDVLVWIGGDTWPAGSIREMIVEADE